MSKPQMTPAQLDLAGFEAVKYVLDQNIAAFKANPNESTATKVNISMTAYTSAFNKVHYTPNTPKSN